MRTTDAQQIVTVGRPDFSRCGGVVFTSCFDRGNARKNGRGEAWRRGSGVYLNK